MCEYIYINVLNKYKSKYTNSNIWITFKSISIAFFFLLAYLLIFDSVSDILNLQMTWPSSREGLSFPEQKPIIRNQAGMALVWDRVAVWIKFSHFWFSSLLLYTGALCYDSHIFILVKTPLANPILAP